LAKVKFLCTAAQEVLQAQPVVSEVAVPAKVFGDIHGHLRDLLLLFHFYGRPGTVSAGVLRPQGSCQAPKGVEPTSGVAMSYVFNGDWVDRGRHQVEVVILLLALKVALPDLVWLNRGNHEDVAQNMRTSRRGALGFDMACMQAFGHQDGHEAFRAFHRVFEWLPLAARVGGRVLVLHGGIGKGDWSLDALRNVERPLSANDLPSALGGVVYNILWSDPLSPNRKRPEETFGVHRSHRTKNSTVMKKFGRDITERFCEREGLGLIIRSHQFKRWGKGYELRHDGWLMRVFTARNYCGDANNDGGSLLIGRAACAPGTLLVRPQNIMRIARSAQESTDQDRRSIILPQEEPYCPKAHLMRLVHPSASQREFLRLISRLLGVGERRNVECNNCGAEELQEGRFFRCHGCANYDLCLDCAARTANTPSHASKWQEDDSDHSGYDSDDSFGSEGCDKGVDVDIVAGARAKPLPTLLPIRASATAAALKAT